MLFKKEPLETLGSRVKMAIHMRGKTPADIERETGVAKSYISRVVNNKISNPKKFIKLISEYLLISEDWLMSGKGRIDIDPQNTIKIYDIYKKENSGVLIVYNKDQTRNYDLKAWKGFDFSPYDKNSIFISRSPFNNDNGDYIVSKDGEFEIVLRFNDSYSSKWFFKKNLIEIKNIENYKILGFIIASIIDCEIKSIEV
ncbi:helix-turn-helix transcriptional regulator (plasmid) [Vibrio chagasii]|uniref:helix-turn-helix domain-containing protein n=1 Tax=Vibrio chagasii TaxID=170679 RepID=UPI003DA93AA4